MPQTFTHGYHVSYEEDAREGFHYLMYELDAGEAKVFFDEARIKGFAKFETNNHQNFTLTYTRINGGFSIEPR